MEPISLEVKVGRTTIKLTHGWFTGIMLDGKGVCIDFEIDCPGCKEHRLEFNGSNIDEEDCIKLKEFFESTLIRMKPVDQEKSIT